MKALIYVLLITTIILISFKQEQNSKKIFQQLNALQGTWRMETSSGPLYESWTNTNDALMQSNSYKLKEKDTVYWSRFPYNTQRMVFFIFLL
jgi:hypothetical protein